jgi:hypothetical protein
MRTNAPASPERRAEPPPPTPEQTRASLIHRYRLRFGWPSVLPAERCLRCGCVLVARQCVACGADHSLKS